MARTSPRTSGSRRRRPGSRRSPTASPWCTARTTTRRSASKRRSTTPCTPGASSWGRRSGDHAAGRLREGTMERVDTPPRVRISDLVVYFLRLGAVGFGGPVALVGQMEKELVQERRWLTKDEFREGVAVCQSLPGPLAIQVGIFISYIRGGFWGAWAGGWAFILPNFIFVAALGALFVYFGDLPPVKAIFYGVSPAVIARILGQLLVFFLKAGSLTFGSGLVIVPFLENGLVRQTGWLNERQFLVAVAMGMLSPGPVVITATFVGYLVAGFWGSVISTVGIFLPSFLLVLIVAPILIRHRGNPNVQGFVKGAYAAAIGTILGAAVLLGKIAIGDWLTALIALASLVALARRKVGNPALVAVAAAVGLVGFSILKPAWVFVK